ncbi:hypothetical protein [Spirosoma sp. KNUC1025]|uniref:hypothetical protein n=1 Tax=Spirosoma sp. KNUC1025 TaxID=2894082 RepID=UPI003867C6B8|nr:hypothetical protein LN737_15545 [Spirosoma sp. KNUC1025]
MTPQTSGRVETGQLPEWLGNHLLTQFGLYPSPKPLSRQDLKSLFVPLATPGVQHQAGLQNALLLLFFVLVLLERWLALTRNA